MYPVNPNLPNTWQRRIAEVATREDNYEGNTLGARVTPKTNPLMVPLVSAPYIASPTCNSTDVMTSHCLKATEVHHPEEPYKKSSIQDIKNINHKTAFPP
jgi:hypothetical protein